MRLVLIQGNSLANYIGRKQDCILQVDGWNPEWDPRPFIEEFRMTGELALET